VLQKIPSLRGEKKVLKHVYRNMDGLTFKVSMIQIEDLSDRMQRQVVGVPWDWFRLFYFLENITVCYNKAHVEAGPSA
jgi:hypothetical protein